MEQNHNKRAEESLDAITRPVFKALAEIASLSPEHAETVVLRLLQKLNEKWPFLRFMLGVTQDGAGGIFGFSNDDLYEIYRTAHGLLREGNVEKCLVTCEALLVLTPGHGAVMSLMSGCYAEQGRYEKALEHIEQALQINDASLEDHLQKARFLYRLGQLEQSAATLRTLLDRDRSEESEEAQEARALLEELQVLLGEPAA